MSHRAIRLLPIALLAVGATVVVAQDDDTDTDADAGITAQLVVTTNCLDASTVTTLTSLDIFTELDTFFAGDWAAASSTTTIAESDSTFTETTCSGGPMTCRESSSCPSGAITPCVGGPLTCRTAPPCVGGPMTCGDSMIMSAMMMMMDHEVTTSCTLTTTFDVSVGTCDPDLFTPDDDDDTPCTGGPMTCGDDMTMGMMMMMADDPVTAEEFLTDLFNQALVITAADCTASAVTITVDPITCTTTTTTNGTNTTGGDDGGIGDGTGSGSGGGDPCLGGPMTCGADNMMMMMDMGGMAADEGSVGTSDPSVVSVEGTLDETSDSTASKDDDTLEYTMPITSAVVVSAAVGILAFAVKSRRKEDRTNTVGTRMQAVNFNTGTTGMGDSSDSLTPSNFDADVLTVPAVLMATVPPLQASESTQTRSQAGRRGADLSRVQSAPGMVGLQSVPWGALDVGDEMVF